MNHPSNLNPCVRWCGVLVHTVPVVQVPARIKSYGPLRRRQLPFERWAPAKITSIAPLSTVSPCTYRSDSIAVVYDHPGSQVHCITPTFPKSDRSTTHCKSTLREQQSLLIKHHLHHHHHYHHQPYNTSSQSIRRPFIHPILPSDSHG